MFSNCHATVELRSARGQAAFTSRWVDTAGRTRRRGEGTPGRGYLTRRSPSPPSTPPALHQSINPSFGQERPAWRVLPAIILTVRCRGFCPNNSGLDVRSFRRLRSGRRDVLSEANGQQRGRCTTAVDEEDESASVSQPESPHRCMDVTTHTTVALLVSTCVIDPLISSLLFLPIFIHSAGNCRQTAFLRYTRVSAMFPNPTIKKKIIKNKQGIPHDRPQVSLKDMLSGSNLAGSGRAGGLQENNHDTCANAVRVPTPDTAQWRTEVLVARPTTMMMNFPFAPQIGSVFGVPDFFHRTHFFFCSF